MALLLPRRTGKGRKREAGRWWGRKWRGERRVRGSRVEGGGRVERRRRGGVRKEGKGRKTRREGLESEREKVEERSERRKE